MHILCFGQQNWDYCWTAKQQYMTRLARRGHRVLYVDPDLRSPQSARESARALAPVRTGLGLREFQPNLWILTCPYAGALGWRLNHRRHPAVVAATVRRLGLKDPIALTLLPPRSSEMFAAVQPAAKLYYPVDEFAAFGRKSEEEIRQIRRVEEDLLREVDVALAVSPRLVRRLRQVQPRTYLLENAADTEHFSPEGLDQAEPHPDLAGLPRPRLGFVGQLDERLDQELLLYLSRERPDWQIVLAGRAKQGVDFSALQSAPNVHLLGYQDYAALPSVLREVDVCLVPYRLCELTQSCWPLKTFEYLATGKAVVATPLESLLRLRGTVSLAGAPRDFLNAVESALKDGDASREARLEVARSNSWDHRVDEMEQRMFEALDVAQRRPCTRGLASPRRQQVPAAPNYAAAATGLTPSFRAIYRLTRAAGHAWYGARLAGRALRGRPAPVRRILVARESRLGDTIAALPMIAALRRRYPDAKIVLGVQRGFSSEFLLRGPFAVDEVRVLDHLKPPSTLAQTLRGTAWLFAEGFDLVICGAAFSMMREPFLSGAPRMIGLNDGHPLQRLNTQTLPLDPTRHESENNLTLIEALGGWAEPLERVPLIAGPGASQSADELLTGLGIPHDATLLTIHAGSQKPSRRWPEQNFRRLIARVLNERPEVYAVLTGSPGERELVDVIRSGLPPHLQTRAVSAVGRTDLDGLVLLLRQSAAFVCNDTGTMHLARAAGAPLVALLGPENHERWGPHPLGTAPAIALRHIVPCSPCSLWDCEPLFCLKSLGVDEVLTAVNDLLDRPVATATCDARDTGEPRWYHAEFRVTSHDWSSLAMATTAEAPRPVSTSCIVRQDGVKPAQGAGVEAARE